MDEVTKNMVTAQLKSAKTPEMLHDSMVSAIFLPVDATYALCKKDTPTTPDPPQENIQSQEEAK